MAKIRNFDIFGAVFPHFCPWAVIGHVVRSPCQILRLSGQRVAPAAAGRRENPFLDH